MWFNLILSLISAAAVVKFSQVAFGVEAAWAAGALVVFIASTVGFFHSADREV